MTEPANIAELRRGTPAGFSLDSMSIYVPVPTIRALLARSERLERAVDLLRRWRRPSLTQDEGHKLFDGTDDLLAEHDAAKEAT